MAADGSRLVFDIPTGSHIGFAIAGLLRAMGALPLVVVPLAQPAPIVLTNAMIIAQLAGGVDLVRTKAGTALVMTSGAVEERDVVTGDIASALIEK